jgi:ABC-type transport system substrate-binding protein
MFLLLFFVLAGTSNPVGCSRREPLLADDAGELLVEYIRPPTSFDPAESSDIDTYNVVRLLYEGLLDYEPASLTAGRPIRPRLAPIIAESFSCSDDGLVWKFRLRRGVRFIDDPCFPSGLGRTISAGDVKYSIERGLQRTTPPGRRADVPPIVGVSAFLNGASAELAGIAAPSPLELTISLDRPDPTLPYFLITPPCRVVPREAVVMYGAGFARHPVGSGPFRLVSAETTTGIAVVRNRHYWRGDGPGGRFPRLAGIRFEPPGDKVLTFYGRRTDVVVRYRSPWVPNPASEENGDSLTLPTSFGDIRQFRVRYLNTIWVGFNFRSHHPAVQDRVLRRAIALAAPRPREGPADGLLPPGLEGADSPENGQRTDREQATVLLQKRGHPSGRGVPEIRLGWRTDRRFGGPEFADSLRSAGFAVRLTYYTEDDLTRAVRSGAVDLFRKGWIADYPDPQDFLRLFYSGSSVNAGLYRNQRFDRLFETLREETDRPARTALVRDMEALLRSETAGIFLCHDIAYHLVSPRVRNYSPYGTNPLNISFLEFVRVSPERN